MNYLWGDIVPGDCFLLFEEHYFVLNIQEIANNDLKITLTNLEKMGKYQPVVMFMSKLDVIEDSWRMKLLK